MTELKDMLAYSAEITDKALDNITAGCDGDYAKLGEAIRYSLLGGGKRLRAHLVLEFCRLCGGDQSKALNYACAIEMIHAFSLIHDDLPCMDNDDMRRGKPSCHIAFGYDTALLAGDALLSMAFDTAASADLPPSVNLQAVKLLARASGRDGMVGGQVLDMIGEERAYTEEELEKTQALKTGALIVCAAQLGVLAAGGDGAALDAALDAAQKYASALGLAFQIRDDILDSEGSSADLGKPTGSDRCNNKSTFYSLLGSEKAKERTRELTCKAVEAIACVDGSERLIAFAEALISRKF